MEGQEARERGPPVTGEPDLDGVVTFEVHLGCHPTWICEACAEPWPCSTFRAIPTDDVTDRLLPVMSFMLRTAIRDRREQAQGPEPHEIARRFLWFLGLTDDEARASAATVR
ncbi:hypothetical protein AB0B63_28005 [Micromonospora sp. NPDC049081]|uniref:hypothetical protein n=1 Tax=Micromonospora sp. NPDC049081 TaxID=3155150 RepID=UPI00340BEF35